jgi:hypothetical protein
VSMNPVRGAVTWTVAVVVDLVAVAVAALFLWNDHHCSRGTVACPAAGQVAHQDVVVLAALAAVLLVVAVLALVRGRLVLLLLQVGVLVVVALAAHRAVPAATDQLQQDVHLGVAVNAHTR